MKTKTMILIAIAMIATAAAPVNATGTALLESRPSDDTLELSWDVVGTIDSMTLHWIDSDGDQGSVDVAAISGGITMTNPDEATLYILEIQANGETSFSNPTSNWPRCHPQSWIAVVGYPPFVHVAYDCIRP